MDERKKPLVTYRKKKHSRSPKFWEVEYLFGALQEAVNTKDIIERVAEAKDVELHEINNISFDPELIWYLSDAVEAMYGLLLREGLINSANISKVQPTQH